MTIYLLHHKHGCINEFTPLTKILTPKNLEVIKTALSKDFFKLLLPEVIFTYNYLYLL